MNFMDNIIQNQKVASEYAELYKNLHKEVSQQNQQTAQIPQKMSLVDYLGKQNDTVEFSNGFPQKMSLVDYLDKQTGNEMLNGSNVESAFSSLLNTIKTSPNSAYESQNNFMANRIAALLLQS